MADGQQESCECPGATVTEFPGQGGLNDRDLFSQSLQPGVQGQGAGRLAPSEAMREGLSRGPSQPLVVPGILAW